MTLPQKLMNLSSLIIPNISPGVAKLITLLSDDEVDVDNVSTQLELFPVVSARLIGLANSAWSAPDRPIVDLKSACVRLGLGVVKSSAIAYAVAAPFDSSKCKAFDGKRFWACNLLSSEAADYLAGRYGIDGSVARTGAMLRNLGLVWLADSAPAETNEALTRSAPPECADLLSAFSQQVGLDHLSATQRLLQVWEISEQLWDCCGSKDASALMTVSALSSRIASETYLRFQGEIDDSIDRCDSEEIDEATSYLEKRINKIEAIAQSIVA